MNPPKVFISYSHDDAAHRHWVLALATRLRKDGVDVTLDRWALAFGDQLPAFMENAVRDNNFVLIICTPRYKQRSDSRIGGVGYEGDVMTGEVLTFGDRRKFIPVLARGEWATSAPSWLLGTLYVALSADIAGEQYDDLLRTLYGIPPDIPELGVAWPIEASRAAQYVHNHHHEAHRGALLWYSNVTAVFGNDGYTGHPEDDADNTAAVQRARAEVCEVRRELKDLKIDELGFGTDRSGYTWALLARTADVHGLHELVWRHYPNGASNNGDQQRLAFTRLWSYWTTPLNDQTIVFDKVSPPRT